MVWGVNTPKGGCKKITGRQPAVHTSSTAGPDLPSAPDYSSVFMRRFNGLLSLISGSKNRKCDSTKLRHVMQDDDSMLWRKCLVKHWADV